MVYVVVLILQIIIVEFIFSKLALCPPIMGLDGGRKQGMGVKIAIARSFIDPTPMDNNKININDETRKTLFKII